MFQKIKYFSFYFITNYCVVVCGVFIFFILL